MRTAVKISGAIFAFAILCVLLSLAVQEFGFFTGDIDVNSGRIRRCQFFLGARLRDTVSDTEFSLLVEKCGLRSSPEDWRPLYRNTHTLVSNNHEDYKVYGGGNALCKLLAMEAELESWGEEETRARVSEFLTLLRNGDIEKMDARFTEITKGDKSPDAPQRDSGSPFPQSALP